MHLLLMQVATHVAHEVEKLLAQRNKIFYYTAKKTSI